MNHLILLRADGSAQLGMGHIMRCIALAQGLEDHKIKPVFVTRNYDHKIINIIKDYGYLVKPLPHDCSLKDDAQFTLEAANQDNASLIITDLSNTDTLNDLSGFREYVKVLKRADKALIAIDSLGKECISARLNLPFDIIIVPYFDAEDRSYKTGPRTKLLLGPDYFIFRQEFIKVAKEDRKIKKNAQNILITMGGGDTIHLTSKVVKALSELQRPNLNLKILPGIAFRTPEHPNMAELMLWADLAIISSGLTKYETAVTGTPSLAISSNDFQEEIMEEFEQVGSVLHLGQGKNIKGDDIIKAVNRLLDDWELRKQMSQKGRNLVDGKGVERIIPQIHKKILS